MANRTFNRSQALEKEVKTLYADVSFGASGAPTLTKGLGVTSVSRNSAGDYTFTLDDQYSRLMYFNGCLVDSTEEDLRFQVQSESTSSSTKQLSFFSLTGATATDPSDGSRALFRFDLKNSSVGE